MPGKNVYDQLCRMNQGFEEVRRSLQALSRYPSDSPGSYHAYRQLHGWNLPPLMTCAVRAHR